MSGIRFGGIASGLDTESLVKELMNAERMKVDKLYQSKTTKTWTQEAYNTVNKDTANFIVDARKSLGLTSSTSYGTSITKSYESFSWVKSASSSDESVFTAKASTTALSGTHTLEVTQLAEGVNVASGSAIENKTLGELKPGLTDGSTFEINGTTVTVNAGDDLSALADKINEVSKDTGVKASYDSTAQRFFLSTTSTGSEVGINITGANKDLFVGTDSILDTDVTDGGIVGQDALISFDGANDISYKTNQFTINGIEIDLKSAEPGTVNTIKVDTNIDGIMDKISEFVESYNSLIDGLSSKLSEKSYRDYQPLSDEEKAAMDEDTIKLWEEKAKSGLLRNDSTIDRMLSRVRSGTYDEVVGASGSFSALYEIGITTGSYQEKGKLQIDETKLREKLMEDPDGVMDMLFKTSDSTDDDIKRSETGIINRIFDDMAEGMKGMIDKAGAGDNASLYRKVQSSIMIDFVTGGSQSMLDKDLLDIAKRIDNENRRLSSVEDRYWSKFTALEKAMQEMNSQSGWLSQQFGG